MPQGWGDVTPGHHSRVNAGDNEMWYRGGERYNSHCTRAHAEAGSNHSEVGVISLPLFPPTSASLSLLTARYQQIISHVSFIGKLKREVTYIKLEV